MTFFVEIGPPFQWKPGKFRSRVMTRVWWGWFAFGVLHIPWSECLDQKRFEWRQ